MIYAHFHVKILTMSSNITPKTEKLIKNAVLAICAAIVVLFLGIRIYNNRKIDSLDGFWESRGEAHYVAYVHGDMIDIFFYDDRNETGLRDENSARFVSGRFTPPEPGFNRYEWNLDFDYDRSNANLVEWHSDSSLHIGRTLPIWIWATRMARSTGITYWERPRFSTEAIVNIPRFSKESRGWKKRKRWRKTPFP